MATRIPQEQVPALLAPDAARGPWAVIPQFTLMDDASIRCSGISIEWCPMLTAEEAGVRSEHPGDMVPWEVFVPETAPEPQELTATVVRTIAITSVVERARRDLRALESLASAFDQWAANPPGAAHEAVVRRNLVTDPRRQRIKKLDAAHYEEVARVYREAPRHPRKAVAEHFQVSPATASDYIGEARHLEILPPTTRGKRSP